MFQEEDCEWTYSVFEDYWRCEEQMERPLEPTKNELLKLNKRLHTLLLGGKRKGASDILNKGGSFAYFNFEGICHAAETGNIDIFYDIFENSKYSNVIDIDLGKDLLDSANDEGHTDLAELIKHYSANFVECIEDANLIGMNSFRN